MQTSYFLAKLLGPTLKVIGLFPISLAASAMGSSATAGPAVTRTDAAAGSGAIPSFGSFR